ncbi:MAG: sulfur oxidation c-type cytochrome SoxA, partial [Burkholderiales bacterium]|nr:sulfur oxidation c-type cytochrome SoxA [Burkholderiales bacterium]
MNRRRILLTATVAVFSLQLPVHAGPAEDLRAFQDYFRKTFPNVPFDDFANGLYALPQASDARQQWEQVMKMPPYEIDLEKGKQFWEQNGLGSCFKNRGRNIAQHYPYWDPRTKMVRTVELDINECLLRKGKATISDLKKGTMAQVAAYMKSLSRGQRVNIDISTPEAQAAYDEGKRFYWSKR